MSTCIVDSCPADDSRDFEMVTQVSNSKLPNFIKTTTTSFITAVWTNVVFEYMSLEYIAHHASWFGESRLLFRTNQQVFNKLGPCPTSTQDPYKCIESVQYRQVLESHNCFLVAREGSLRDARKKLGGS